MDVLSVLSALLQLPSAGGQSIADARSSARDAWQARKARFARRCLSACNGQPARCNIDKPTAQFVS
ncbi:MAG: hypothetical protein JSR14_03530 [Proteobacteria bacterium]|nr:hypothetical protein [Pseudomonadota bacterium]